MKLTNCVGSEPDPGSEYQGPQQLPDASYAYLAKELPALLGPIGIKQALKGCWDRQDWPERAQRRAQEPELIWEQAVCFDGNRRAAIDIMSNSEGWGDVGTFTISGERVVMTGMVWVDADQLSCEPLWADHDSLAFTKCIGKSGGRHFPVDDAAFRRNDWSVEKQFGT